MIWSLALYPDDAKQGPVVYGADIPSRYRRIVFLHPARVKFDPNDI